MQGASGLGIRIPLLLMVLVLATVSCAAPKEKTILNVYNKPADGSGGEAGGALEVEAVGAPGRRLEGPHRASRRAPLAPRRSGACSGSCHRRRPSGGRCGALGGPRRKPSHLALTGDLS